MTGAAKANGRPALDEVEPLGAYDTPAALALAVVDRVIDVVPELRGKASRQFERILEPSVGGGAFVRALVQRFPDPFDSPAIEVFDLDPFAPGVTEHAGRVEVMPYRAPDRVTLPPRLGTCVACGAWHAGEGPEGVAPDHASPGAAKRAGPCPGSRRAVLPPVDPTFPDPVRCGFLIAEPKARPTIVIGNPPYAVRVPWRPKTPEPVAHLHAARALDVTARHVFLVLRQSWIAPDRHRDLTDSGHLRAVWTIRPRPPFSWFGTTKSTDSGPSALFWFDRGYDAPRYADGSVRFDSGFLDWKEPDGVR